MSAMDTIRELLESRLAQEEANQEYKNIAVISDCENALDWLEKYVERKLYIEDRDVDDSYALAILLQEEVVYTIDRKYIASVFKTENLSIEGPIIVIFVLCNDLFAWGMADAEPLDNIESLYKMHVTDKEWGSAKWCCIHRNEQPQDPIKKDMQDAGVWDEKMEALPENKFSKRIRERNEQRLSNI